MDFKTYVREYIVKLLWLIHGIDARYSFGDGIAWAHGHGELFCKREG